MTVFGKFPSSGAEIVGEICTFGRQSRNPSPVRIVRDAGTMGEQAPTHRVFVGRAGIATALVEGRQRTEGLSVAQAR